MYASQISRITNKNWGWFLSLEVDVQLNKRFIYLCNMYSCWKQKNKSHLEKKSRQTWGTRQYEYRHIPTNSPHCQAANYTIVQNQPASWWNTK